MFDVFYFGPKPNIFEREQFAEDLEAAARLSKTRFFWYIYGGNDYSHFNFNWQPVPWEADHVHAWPSQWQQDGQVYFANKRTAWQRQWHWRTEQRVTRLPDTSQWLIPGNIDAESFDYSWHPDPHSPPFEYHFGTQWQISGGPKYRVANAVDIKFCNDVRAVALPNMTNWIVPDNIDATTIDFSWHPSDIDPPYVYHFPSEWQQTSGLIYTVPGATDIKLMDDAPTLGGRMSKAPDIFFVDRSNPGAQARYDRLANSYSNIQKIRYANSMLETIKRCANRSTTTKFWVISSENIYDNFDFTWHPETWQGSMTHVFGSQWQKWSDTFLINRWELERNAGWARGIEEFPNLNFVTDQQIRRPDDNYDIYFIDHRNPESAIQLGELQHNYTNVKSTRFVDNYLDTFKRVMSTATSEYVWIISSLCDYADFDFGWQPEPWQAEMIHVFPSGTQRRGDTFYIHVESFKKQMVELELLDWFNVINYCDEQRVERFEPPGVFYESDNLVEEIKNFQFEYPYVNFTNQYGTYCHYNPCLWSAKDRIVKAFAKSGATVQVPRDVKLDLQTQLYDYPYIDNERTDMVEDDPLDIIYISNGEPDAEKWFERLKYSVFFNSKFSHRYNIKRVQNVNGRSAAYKAAAELSDTPWFFAVFAKLEMRTDFDWNWQPDYFQEPKHYIFHAKNPLNGLEYGHMGMIAYNKKLVLETEETGLDFTLSKAHEVVPILSATAYYNQDPWMTWRTAFREVIKLKHFQAESPSMETAYRLSTWCNRAEGNFAEWSLHGANDAVEYYNQVDGDFDKLMLSYEWDWLREYFNSRYK